MTSKKKHCGPEALWRSFRYFERVLTERGNQATTRFTQSRTGSLTFFIFGCLRLGHDNKAPAASDCGEYPEVAKPHGKTQTNVRCSINERVIHMGPLDSNIRMANYLRVGGFAKSLLSGDENGDDPSTNKCHCLPELPSMRQQDAVDSYMSDRLRA